MRKQKGYLTATFPNFPGVRVPLLSDEECKVRGIEPGKFPPFETWTPKQQAAGRKLADILGEDGNEPGVSFDPEAKGIANRRGL